MICCYSWQFLPAHELFTCCTGVNICIRANWCMCNVLCEVHQWGGCIYSPFSITSIMHTVVHLYLRWHLNMECFLVARAAKWGHFLSTYSWEHSSSDNPPPPPAYCLTPGDVNSDVTQITCGLLQGCRSIRNKTSSPAANFSAVPGEREGWVHLCTLSWNILLSCWCGGGNC